jgi:hypothetical protein
MGTKIGDPFLQFAGMSYGNAANAYAISTGIQDRLKRIIGTNSSSEINLQSINGCNIPKNLQMNGFTRTGAVKINQMQVPDSLITKGPCHTNRIIGIYFTGIEPTVTQAHALAIH